MSKKVAKSLGFTTSSLYSNADKNTASERASFDPTEQKTKRFLSSIGYVKYNYKLGNVVKVFSTSFTLLITV